MQKILGLVGSIKASSMNLSMMHEIKDRLADDFTLSIFNALDQLPHFNPDLDKENPPPAIADLRAKIESADGILICTPEYVFSIPAALKNAIEWMVSTTLFSEKPVALITASSAGEKGHESLQLVLRTLYCKLPEETSLLIRGAKANLKKPATWDDIDRLLENFYQLINESSASH